MFLLLYSTELVGSFTYDGVIGTYKRVVIHPMEKPFIQSGKEFPVFELDDITFGVLICFEIARH